MTIDNNAGSLTENLISLIEAAGGARPASKGLQELYQALAVALAALAPGGGVLSVVAGTNVTVDDTDPHNPIVSATGSGGGVESVTGSTSITVDNTDPDNPIVERAAITGDAGIPANSNTITFDTVNTDTGTFGDDTHVAAITVNGKGLITGVTSVEISSSGGGIVDSVVAGTNVTVDDTDPANPIVSATGGGGSSLFVAPVELASNDVSDMAASPPSGAANIDGVAVTTGMRVLLLAQFVDPDDGVWEANTAGDWTRPSDWDTGSSIPGGTLVAVNPGPGQWNWGSIFMLGGDITVGTDNAEFNYVVSAAGFDWVAVDDDSGPGTGVFAWPISFPEVVDVTNLPTSDPGSTGKLWVSDDQVVLSGFTPGGGSFPDFTGTGSPEGVVTANYGQYYEDTGGSGSGTSGLYVFSGSDASDTGWIAISGNADQSLSGITVDDSGNVNINGLATANLFGNTGVAIASATNGIIIQDINGDGVAIQSGSDIEISVLSSVDGGIIEYNVNGQQWVQHSDGSVQYPLITTVDEPLYSEGEIYYNSTLGKFRIGGASAWETVQSGPVSAGAVTQIANQILSSTAASVTFTSIPGTYNHLNLKAIGATNSGDTTDNWKVTFNSVATNYNQQIAYIHSTTLAAQLTGASTTWNMIAAGSDLAGGSATAGAAGTLDMTLFNYAATVFFRTGSWRSGVVDTATTTGRTMVADIMNTSTAAITALTITPSNNDFIVGSSFYLYGIT